MCLLQNSEPFFLPELQLGQLAVQATLPDQRGVAALLDHLSPVDPLDRVRVLDRGELTPSITRSGDDTSTLLWLYWGQDVNQIHKQAEKAMDDSANGSTNLGEQRGEYR